MTAFSNLYSAPLSSNHIRPFDVSRDMEPVADLVEKCFAGSLDHDGRQYINKMRSAARSKTLLKMASVNPGMAGMPFSGFVWEEDGTLIGNVSLIPYTYNNQRMYLIANVAVHPYHRLKGVARSLTAKAMDFAQKNGSPGVWLHVREENDPALNLYRSIGFSEYTRRTTWLNAQDATHFESLSGVSFRSPKRSLWHIQKSWLNQSYPPEVTWHLSFNIDYLKPGLIGTISRLVNNIKIKQWCALKGDQLLCTLSWQATSSYADSLWLAVPADINQLILQSLLSQVHNILNTSRPFKLDYPARQHEKAIQNAGFYPQQTLIWMSFKF
jgi:ribosomal protein S18 acetylase RimI-like enzyme